MRELVALKWKDLKDSYLHIRRMEQKQYKEDADGSWHYQIEVVEHTKSDASYRTIYVVSSALEIFAKIKEYNLQRGFSCDAEDYIFIYRNKHYCFSRYSDEQKRNELEKTLNV